ncbi:MAG: hypothetical protein U1F71_08275 [Verrucomicrobiaceae bacterium]
MRLPFLFILLTLSLHAVELTFPKFTDAKRVRGELVSADFIHRSGQFRTGKGELIDFTMPPYAVMKYRGSEADMREVPLGTKMDFLLLPGVSGRPMLLLTTDDGQKPDAEQQKKFREFTEKRGVAGWITKTEGKQVTVILFSGDPAFYESAYGELLAKGKSTRTCVANDELRTWNPGVDGEGGSIQDVQKLPADGFGCSGYQITVSVSNMLEGFRKGRVVRIFLQGWKVQDQFYGESLMGYGFGRMLNPELIENVAKEYPEQFPFRTDRSNEKLPWYQLKPGQEPPPFAEHVVDGALVKSASNGGQFVAEKGGQVVDFTLIDKAKVKYLNADASLSDIPSGTRCRFHLYQDENGQFTKAGLVSDEFSHSSTCFITARVIALHLKDRRIDVAWQLPEVKDYNGDMQRPKDIGWRILSVNDETRVWKGAEAAKLADLAVGDLLLFNSTAGLPGKPAHCTDLWVGEDTHKLVAEKQRKDRGVAQKKP